MPSENIFRRLVNANLRVGGARQAQTLLAFGANDSLPMSYRLLALKALQMFDDPPAIDSTLGIYLPLDERDSGEIRMAIESKLTELFESATGDLAAATVQVMTHYGVRLDKRSVVTRMRDGRQPIEVRLAALNQLIADKDFSQKLLMKSLLEDEDPVVRNGACRAYVVAFPNEAMETIRNMLTKFDDLDFRTAYDLLAERNDSASAQVLGEQIDKMLSGDLFRTVHLDLYLAAKRCTNSDVTAKLARVERWLATQEQAVHSMTVSGGDADRGRAVFQNQGVCLKCHKAERGGGDAGPELTYIARLRQPHELLESVLEPNAIVVPGFGTISIVTDEGLTLEGTPISEDEHSITIKTAVGETKVIALDSIDERTDIRSPMPKQAENLSLLEIRDLMAYLQQLTARN